MQETTIPNCPFCKSAQVRLRRFGGEDLRRIVSEEERWTALAVRCEDCLATGPLSRGSGWIEDEESAISAWAGERPYHIHAGARRLGDELDGIASTVACTDTAETIRQAAVQMRSYDRALSDPEAVHVNLLRGSIARPSRLALLHLAGATDHDHLRRKVEEQERRIAIATRMFDLALDPGADPVEKASLDIDWRITMPRTAS